MVPATFSSLRRIKWFLRTRQFYIIKWHSVIIKIREEVRFIKKNPLTFLYMIHCIMWAHIDMNMFKCDTCSALFLWKPSWLWKIGNFHHVITDRLQKGNPKTHVCKKVSCTQINLDKNLNFLLQCLYFQITKTWTILWYFNKLAP